MEYHSAMTSKLPDKIYLQWVGDDSEPVNPNEIMNHNDVTWCSEKVFKRDVKYVRVKSEPKKARK